MIRAGLLRSNMNPSELIDNQIASFPDWRGKLMTKLRKTLLSVSPKLTEGWKWDVGVWTNNGLVCAVAAFKDHVKINFFKGVHLKDVHKLLNSGLTSKNHRAIDFHEGDNFDTEKLSDLIKEAIALNSK